MSHSGQRAASILAASIAMAAATAPGEAAASGKEKCYGVAVAGENHCANAAGTHACAKQSTQDFHGGDWQLVPAGTCTELGGEIEPFDGFGKAAKS